MGTNERIFWRELGCRRPTTGRASRPLEENRPLAFERSFNSSEGLMKRLTQTAEFKGDAACVSNITWTPDGQFLAAGGEDCRITIWEQGTRQLKQTIDMGHTSFINCVRYLPSRNNEYIVSASNDKEVRLVNLVKKAVMPYKSHKGKVKSIAVIEPAMFMSGGEDGTVRQVDLRENARTMTLIADQRQEKTGLVKTRVPINSIALCPLHPHLFATGGGDAIVRLYDRRMSSGQGSKPHKTPWFAGYMPMHFKRTLAHRPHPMPSTRQNVHISGVAFSHDGRKLFASYTNEQIYSFSCKQHQRAAAYFEAPDPSAHATRSTARLHRPTERRWLTAAWSQDTAEALQPPVRGAAQQQQQQEGAPREAEAASAAQAAAQGAHAAEHAPETVPLATAITMATQQFIQSIQAAQPPDEALRERVREMAEEIHAQAAPAPESDVAGPEEAHVPDQALLRRTASAPMPEVAHSVEAFTAGTFTNAIILGVNAAFQQGQATAAGAAQGAERAAHARQAGSASRHQPALAAAAASTAEGDADAPVVEERQEARVPRQAARRGGSRSRLASRSGSAQAPLAQSVGRVAPGPPGESPSALESPHAAPLTAAPVVSPVTRQAARRAGQPDQATRPAGALAAADRALDEAPAQSLNQLRLTLRDSRLQARREEAEAELARVGPPARRQRRALGDPGSPGRNGMSVPGWVADLRAYPADAAHAMSELGVEAQAADAARPMRQTASTLAAAGNAYAVAGRNAERPTASTGTSRPLTRQQAWLKKEEGSPDVPEQASGRTGQPRAFRAPPPRTRSARHASTSVLGTAEGEPAELPAGQAPEQMRPARQRRMRQQKGHISECHSGAGSTSQRAGPLPGQQGQVLPARRTQVANGEASSGLPPAQPAVAARAQQHVATRTAHDTSMQNRGEAQHQAHGAEPQLLSIGEEDNRSAPGAIRTGAARRRRNRAALAAAGGSEPVEDAEDVCCERSQSARAQDKRDKGAASPASVQHALAEPHDTEPGGNTLDAPERPLHTRTYEASASAQQQASPQLATIQDGASQGPRRRAVNTGQQHRQAAAAAAARPSAVPGQADAPEGVSEVGMAGGSARLPNEPRTGSGLPLPDGHETAASVQQRGFDTALPARSSPNSSAAAIDTVHQGDEEADVVGPSAHQRHARQGAAGEGNARAGEARQRQQGADSYIGAIMDVCDADDGEVVEEDGMFDMVYSGHCNKQGCKEVSLIGEQSDFMCSGSDGGSIFIWNARTGQLVNVLRANETVTTCVAPHPHAPMLASCGFEPAVRLWSPEAGEATKLEHAEEVMRQNALELAQRSEAQIAAPQIFLNMGLVPPNAALPMPAAAPAPELHLNAGNDNRDNAVRCTIM